MLKFGLSWADINTRIILIKFLNCCEIQNGGTYFIEITNTNIKGIFKRVVAKRSTWGRKRERGGTPHPAEIGLSEP